MARSRNVCPICKQVSQYNLSRDHIIPQMWANPSLIKQLLPDTISIKRVCRRCNETRAELGHCVGALACFLDLERHSKHSIHALIHRYSRPKIDRQRRKANKAGRRAWAVALSHIADESKAWPSALSVGSPTPTSVPKPDYKRVLIAAIERQLVRQERRNRESAPFTTKGQISISVPPHKPDTSC